MRHGTVHWSECIVDDVEAAKALYGAMFGWTFDTMPMPNGGTYTIAMSGSQMAAGLMCVDDIADPSIIPQWMTYLAVADLDAALAAAASTGGTVSHPPFEVPGVGRIAMVLEPSGALAGIIQPALADAA